MNLRRLPENKNKKFPPPLFALTGDIGRIRVDVSSTSSNDWLVYYLLETA